MTQQQNEQGNGHDQRPFTRGEQVQQISVDTLGMLVALFDTIAAAIHSGVALTPEHRVNEEIEGPYAEDLGNDMKSVEGDRLRVDAAQRLRDAWAAVDTHVEQLADLTVSFMRATEALPRDTYAAASQLAAHQVAFENAARTYVDTLEAWREADTQTGRIRQGVVERLMSTDVTLSRTAADKAASGDDEYTQHKDRCAALSDRKDRADIERSVAYSKVETSRRLLDALVQVEAASRMGKVSVKFGELQGAPAQGGGPKVAH
jgi:hypothetical protein